MLERQDVQMYLLPEGWFQRLCYDGLNSLRPATILRVRNRGHFPPTGCGPVCLIFAMLC